MSSILKFSLIEAIFGNTFILNSCLGHVSFKPTLSICIPTYNRGKYLKETLENIYAELNKMPIEQRNMIDICISDNNSSDFTKEIISDFTSYSSVKVIFEINSINLGPDANFLKAISLSNSEFVWLLSSDDRIANGGLQYLYNFLRIRKEIDLVFLNSISCNRENAKQRKIGNSNYEAIRFYQEPLKAALDIIYKGGLISILCFRRSKWEAINGYQKYLSSWYIHQYKFLSMIRDNADTCWILSPELVLYRPGNESILQAEDVFKRINKMLESFYNIPASVFGINSKEHRLLSAKSIKLNFTPFYLLFQVSRLNFKGRIVLLKKFYLFCKGFPFFWYRILPFFVLPIGTNGKFIFRISVDEISKRFHNYK